MGVSIFHILVVLRPKKWSYKLMSIPEKLYIMNRVDTS